MGARPTVLIVDDHEGFRNSARALLEADGFEVIGGAGSGIEALEAAAALRPDIVLLDIQLPGLDGFRVAEQLAEVPEPPPWCSSPAVTQSPTDLAWARHPREASSRRVAYPGRRSRRSWGN